MISIDKFLNDEQEPKVVEKVIAKLNDLMGSNEELIYFAVQKKPAVNLLPDSIAITNKRIFYCTPGNLGLTTNFKDISWKNIKEVSFKEEFFSSKFICVPQQGENIVTDFIPKTQVRKLYQAAHEALEKHNEQKHVEELRSSVSPVTVNTVPVAEIDEPVVINTFVNEQEDETTLKLRKLKTLFEKHLITQQEYEAKKADILNSL